MIISTQPSGKYIYSFLRNLHIVFHCGLIRLHSYQWHRMGSLRAIPRTCFHSDYHEIESQYSFYLHLSGS